MLQYDSDSGFSYLFAGCLKLEIFSEQNLTLYLTNQLHSVYLHCTSTCRNKALWIKEYTSTVLGREWTRWSEPKKDFAALNLNSRVFIHETFSKSDVSHEVTCKSWVSWHLINAVPFWDPEIMPFLSLQSQRNIRNTLCIPENKILIKCSFFQVTLSGTYMGRAISHSLKTAHVRRAN